MGVCGCVIPNPNCSCHGGVGPLITTNPFTTYEYSEAVEKLKAIIAKQDNEIERLREALKKIRNSEPAFIADTRWKIARSALKESE